MSRPAVVSLWGRAIRVGSTVQLIRDGQNVLAETNASGLTTAHYTDSPGTWGGLVSQRKTGTSGSIAAGASEFFVYDLSGNTRMLVSATGGLLAEYAYGAFGNIVYETAQGLQISAASPIQANGMDPGYGKTTLPSTVYLFAGEGGVRLDPSGQYDMRAREYDASIMARFLSRDPLWGDEGGWNWYLYAGNDPVGRMDPSGLQSPSSGLDQYKNWGYHAPRTYPYGPAGVIMCQQDCLNNALGNIFSSPLGWGSVTAALVLEVKKLLEEGSYTKILSILRGVKGISLSAVAGALATYGWCMAIVCEAYDTGVCDPWHPRSSR